MPVSRFVKTFFRIAGGKIVVSFILLLLVGMIQGVGLLLVLPFLHLIGIGEGDTPRKMPAAVDWLVEATEKLGVPWTITTVLVGFVFAITLMSLLKFWQSIHSSNLIRHVTFEFQIRFYRQWMFRSWIESSQHSGGEILNLIQRDIGQLSQFLHYGLSLSTTIVLAIIYSLVAFQLSPFMTGIALGSGIVLFFVLVPLRRQLLCLSESIRGRFKNQLDIVTEHLNALKLIKAFAREPLEQQFLAESVRHVQEESHRITVVSSFSNLIQSILGAALLAGVVYMSVVHFSVDAARLILLVFLFSRILPLLTRIQDIWQKILTSLPSVRAIAEHDADAPENESDDRVEPFELRSDIKFEKLHFAWPGNVGAVLADFSATIPVCNVTAIAGSSGSGKSTLCQLLLGLVEPDSGDILINDEPLSDERLRAWKQSIGYVPQDDFLFSQSIRANLLWGEPNATDEEMWAALESAGASDFVKELPDSIETIVSGKGDSLSGGERQRIAVARALIRNPALLILDEPTSALDSENEAVLREVLRVQSKERTVVLISHRSSLLEIADHVIDLSSGS